jgi:hypothetical protein
MNEILLSNEVIVYLLSETLLYLLLFVAFLVTLGLLKKWNFDAFTTEQFNLENRSYLVMTIIFFVILLKVVLLPYFVYTIDTLSDLIPGAMCGAGVIKANAYGNPLLTLKIIILFLSGVWLSVNSIDLKEKNYSVDILNRSQKRLSFFEENGFISYSWDNFKISSYDLVINTTSAGLSDQSLPVDEALLGKLFVSAKYAVDVIYNKNTPFLQKASDFGLKYKDGKDMLLYQGVIAFEYFFNHKFSQKTILKEMKKAF